MVDFIPLPMIAGQASTDDAGVQPSPEPSGPSSPTRAYYSARCPISRTVDLSTMASGTVVSGVIYRRDFFLCGPFEGAIQGVWLAANSGAGQPNFKIGLVDEDGNVVAALQQLAELPKRAQLLLRLAAETAGRSVYLRVETTVQAVLLYVTLDATLDEVM